MASTTQPPARPIRNGALAASHPILSLYGKLCLREITTTTKGSVLGFLWIVLGPLLSMALYVVVFGVLFGGTFDRGPGETSLQYALGVYIGLSVVNLLNDTIGSAPLLIASKANFVKRIIFPLSLLPLVQVGGISFKWFVNIILWLMFAALLGTLDPGILPWLPVVLIPLLFMAAGLGWAISALSVYFRDIQHVVPVLTQIIFWSSGVFYSSLRVMEYPPVWNILRWNPVLLATENIRHIILWQEPVNTGQLAFLWIVGILTALAGLALFHRLKSGFAELI